VLSDLHLSDAQAPDPKRPLWKRYKGADLFIDGTFGRFLHRLMADVDGPIELVFAGDTFDFDSVTALDPAFSVSWIEARRGLEASEEKSLFKMQVILQAHPAWIDAMKAFLDAGHRAVFIIGNHDIELHWTSVQRLLKEKLGRAIEDESVEVCEWFYISCGDTLIEHGNQYDPYCVCSDPVWPLIQRHGKLSVRMPFGNLASRVMVNGLGLFNPHVDGSYILSTWEYVAFAIRHVRTQPLILFSWLWSAIATLILSLREGLSPAERDPLKVEERVADIARRSNATPRVVRAMKLLHSHPAIYAPWTILRELWLDRALLFAGLLWASFQGFAFLNVLTPIPIAWMLVPLILSMPILVLYSRSVQSEVGKGERLALAAAARLCRLAGVERMIFGHTHHALHQRDEGVEVINTGSWSPAYHDVECTEPFGTKRFACLQPDESGGRTAHLLEWLDAGTPLVTLRRQRPAVAPATDTLAAG
jgi:UDP-2,3-diacylglucosamine pyrophosphatase LpxH